MDELFSLAGRIALVTGGSRGLGKMIAAGFLARGARVYIAGRSPEILAEAAADLSSNGECIAVPLDVTSAEDRQKLTQKLKEREGCLDVLVNNAAVGTRGSFDSFTEEAWDDDMDTNVKAPFFLTQALAGLLRASVARSERPAKVINIASIDGIGLNLGPTFAYQVSKAALVHLTRCLAARLVQENILVTGIAPGAFASDMNVAARDRPKDFGRIVPAGRIGTSEDIAGAAVFLASRAGDYVVGDTLCLDGGFVRARATHGPPTNTNLQADGDKQSQATYEI
ncbi:MAG TPA: SDR family oxidoreductase [Sphingomicrobium sp.]|nr:SDR family oxidoreductase [Sphingomicrobium sp.]